MNGIVDISRAIFGEALVYPGDPAPAIEPLQRIASGDAVNVLSLRATTHLLTHIDVPRHFFDAGASITDLPPDRFAGPALVIPVEGPAVLPEHIPAAVSGLNLLFKTRHSGPWDPVYDVDHAYISLEAARVIAARGANLAGIDYLDIDRHGDPDYPAHRALLSAGVLILEGIDLADVEPGPYTLISLPLKIAGADGSPVRAVLLPPALPAGAPAL